jgi:hypothetical protein
LQGCKNVVEQKSTKGEAQLGSCGTRSAEQVLSKYRLLGEVNIAFIHYLLIFY